jgi:hypothetical protein
MPPDAAIYTHELGRAAVHAPMRPCRAFLGRLSCAGEVTAAAQACCAAARTLAPAELGKAEAKPGQAGPRALRRPAASALGHWAAGGFTQWHLIIFLYFPNIFNSLQIQKFV